MYLENNMQFKLYMENIYHNVGFYLWQVTFSKSMCSASFEYLNRNQWFVELLDSPYQDL